MRRARVVEAGGGFYHVISRVVGRERLLRDEADRELFRHIMRAMEAFSGCQVLTWCCLFNHFHILLHVPAAQEVSDVELLARMKFLYRPEKVDEFAEELTRYREAGQSVLAERSREPYVRRMYNLAEFVKTLKQRMTMAYNKRHDRLGTLWTERYKSVLVEGETDALMAISAYIDLNPVRAGLVADPSDYRFSGYGEAMGGSKLARVGLGWVVGGGPSDWSEAGGVYRQLLYIKGQARGLTPEGVPVRPGFSEEEVAAVVSAKGRLPMTEALRCRVRYFTDGVALGSRGFVDAVFQRHRGYFSEKRRDGARAMRGAQWGGLFTARDLRRSVITAAAPAC
jgi:REP element-mobilizing transposase RayT